LKEDIFRRRYRALVRRHLEEAFGTGLRKHTIHKIRSVDERVVAHVTAHLSRDDREHLIEVWMNEHGDLITLVDKGVKETLLKE